MKSTSKRRLALLVLFTLGAFALGVARLGAQVEMSSPEVTDVTPTGFSVVWQASTAATAAITIYADAAGMKDITSRFEVLPLPFHTGSPALADDDISQASYVSEQQLAASSLGVLKVRVEGALPETTYYYRAHTISPDDMVSAPQGVVAAVTTMSENAFLSESRQLLLELATDAAEPSGWLVTVEDSAGDTAYPISAYVGDGVATDQAYLNLARLFGRDGVNWQPIGERDLRIRVWRGWTSGVVEQTVRLDFTGEFAVATTDAEEIALTTPVDSDDDGLNDSWEEENFGGLGRDGSGDFDVDGISDRDEFLEGTSPVTPSLPVVPTIVAPESNSTVSSVHPLAEVFLRSGALGNHFTDIELYAGRQLGELMVSARLPTRGRESIEWTPSTDLSDDSWYLLRVRTSNGHGHSEWVKTKFFVSLVDDPPQAFAVSSPRSGESVDVARPRLEVTNSRDPEGGTITYEFEVFADEAEATLVTRSPRIDAGLDGVTSWTVGVSLSAGQTYFWRARAIDGAGGISETPLTSVVYNPLNGAPGLPGIASPAEGFVVSSLSVDLAVINSVDPDGDALTYSFEIDTGPTFDSPNLRVATGIAEGNGTTSFTASGLADETRYFWRARALDVTSGSAWSTSSFYINLVDDVPPPPLVLNPGDGTLSPTTNPRPEVDVTDDPDGEEISYEFEMYSDDALVELVSACDTAARFWDCALELDDRSVYFWRARARDAAGQMSEWTATHRVTVNTGIPLPPVAMASAPARFVITGEEATLDGSASFDPLGRALEFAWTFLQVPPGSVVDDNSLDDTTAPRPAFTPDTDGTYIVQLRVANPALPDVDRVVLRSDMTRVPPTADAGGEQVVVTGQEVSLDGSASRDPDEGPMPLRFRWSFVSLPESSQLDSTALIDAATATARFTPDVDGIYIVRLRVNDGEHDDEDTVQIMAVSEGGLPPVADAGEDFDIDLGGTAILDGSSTTDPDGGPSPLSFLWRFTSVPQGSALEDSAIGGRETDMPSFTPDVAGQYVLELEVSDGEFTVFDSVVVTALGLPRQRFLRGDVNADGLLDISDPVAALTYQFLGTFTPSCLDAVDFDDTGIIDVTDAINSLSHQFLGSAGPPAPGLESCGVDPTEDAVEVGGELGCETFPFCD